jgi:hypothetical protein
MAKIVNDVFGFAVKLDADSTTRSGKSDPFPAKICTKALASPLLIPKSGLNRIPEGDKASIFGSICGINSKSLPAPTPSASNEIDFLSGEGLSTDARPNSLYCLYELAKRLMEGFTTRPLSIAHFVPIVFLVGHEPSRQR